MIYFAFVLHTLHTVLKYMGILILIILTGWRFSVTDYCVYCKMHRAILLLSNFMQILILSLFLNFILTAYQVLKFVHNCTFRTNKMIQDANLVFSPQINWC